MDVEQPPQDAPPPRPPRQRGKLCFCCGKRYGARQLDRHREIYLAEANAAFAAAAAEGMEFEGGEPVLDDDGMLMDDARMEDRAEVAHEGAEDNDNPFANLALGLEDDGPPLPAIVPVQLNRIIRNPPVQINEWPDPGSDGELEDFKEHERPDDGANRDPDYVECHVEPGQLGLNPLDEPAMADPQLRELLVADLGDLADELWLELYGEFLTQKDERMLWFMATRLRTHFSRQTYNELRHGPCEPLRLPSEFIAWHRLKILSGIPLKADDCCANSCVCFLGQHADKLACPYCHEPRYTRAGQPRRVFHYTPLIPQLKALFRSSETIEKLRYRAMAEAGYDPGIYQDVFDGKNYRTLRQTRVDPDHKYKFFDNLEDLALFFTTDGFTLFKQRRRGLSTAWPLLFINANHHPRYRNRLENVICVGVIPGPKQCKDMNLYLIPSLEELLELHSAKSSGTQERSRAPICS